MSAAHVLVVDDDPNSRWVATEILKDVTEEEIIEAESGRDAIEKMVGNNVAVIVSDVRMNDGDGIWLLSQMNEREDRPAFFFLSGEDMDDSAAMRLGAQGFFAKASSKENMNLLCEYVKLILKKGVLSKAKVFE